MRLDVVGVYCILNLENGRHYVGSAVNVRRRWRQHCAALRADRHHCSKLQRAWNKYGESAFRLDLLEVAEEDALIEREQFWIDQTRPFYNSLRIAGSARGLRHSPETIAKIRAYQGARSEEHRGRLGAAHRGKVMSGKARRRISASKKGARLSDETRARMSRSRAGKRPNDAVLEAAIESCIGEYEVVSPTGEKSRIRNLSAFCRWYGLNQSLMSAVAKGKRGHHKGWLCRRIA